MKKKIIVLCLIIICVLSLCNCAKGEPTFSGLLGAVNNSKKPYLIEARVNYFEEGVTLTNIFSLEIGKDNACYAAKLSWRVKEFAPFESGEQFIFKSGQSYFKDKNYKSMLRQLNAKSGQSSAATLWDLQLKRKYFSYFEFTQDEDKGTYTFLGQLNEKGKEKFLGGIAEQTLNSYIIIEVSKSKNKVLKVELNYQYKQGGQGNITLLFDFELKEIIEN